MEAILLILVLVFVLFLIGGISSDTRATGISSGTSAKRRRREKSQTEYKQGYFTPRYPEKYRGRRRQYHLSLWLGRNRLSLV